MTIWPRSRTLDEPFYLIQGTADDTVPWQMGEQLAKAAGAAHKPGAAFVIKDAGHAPDGEVLAMILRAIAAKLDGDGATVKRHATADGASLPVRALGCVDKFRDERSDCFEEDATGRQIVKSGWAAERRPTGTSRIADFRVA